MKSPIALFLRDFRADAAPAPDLGGPASPAQPGKPATPWDDEALMLPPPMPVEPVTDVIVLPAATAAPEPAPPAPALDEIVAALEQDHAAALAEARRRWAEAEGAALADRFAAALAQFETRLAGTLAPMLEPFLAKAAQIKVLAELGDAIRILLRGDPGQAITVTGPADLLAAIEAAYKGEAALRFAVSDTPDVTVVARDSIVRSRLRDWASVLEASLGEAA